MKILFLVVALSFHQLSFGQSDYNRWSIDLSLGLSDAIKPFAEGYSSNFFTLLHADLGGRYMFNNKFGLKWDVGFDRIKNDEEGPIQGPNPFVYSKEFETHYFRTSLQAVLDIGRVFEFEKIHEKFSMLLHFGGGFSSLKDKKNSIWFQGWKSQGTDEMMNFLIGLTPQLKVHNDWSLYIDVTAVGNGWQSKTFDFTENNFVKGMSGVLYNFSIGASYYIGRADQHLDWRVTCCAVIDPTINERLKKLENDLKDDDGDGVVNATDLEPDTPLGNKVNTLGQTIPDDVTIQESDRDGDGVIDEEDNCPDVAGLAIWYGCPDTDGDGVPDSKDECPTVPGLNANGCPNIDTDNDGVIDSKDDCPTIRGVPENNGCPEITLEVKKILREALIGIQFETDKDVITEESFPILDKVVQVLKDHPEYSVDINGHTDNVGRTEPNKILSVARAEAVEKYLASKGINLSRMEAYGFGDTRPISSNDNPAGRKQNRRVEFKIRFE